MMTRRLTRSVAMALCAAMLGAVPATGLANPGPRLIDDPLEFEVTISTERASKLLRIFGGPWSDNHLVARIDRRTGEATFLVHQLAGYFDLQRRGFRTVHFSTPEGLAKADVTRVKEGPTTCLVPDGTAQCPFQETVTFQVDERVLRWVSDGREADWKFRFKASNGADRDASIPRTEVADLLAAVDLHRAASARSAAAPTTHGQPDVRVARIP